jgi:hypothetical protein
VNRRADCGLGRRCAVRFVFTLVVVPTNGKSSAYGDDGCKSTGLAFRSPVFECLNVVRRKALRSADGPPRPPSELQSLK